MIPIYSEPVLMSKPLTPASNTHSTSGIGSSGFKSGSSPPQRSPRARDQILPGTTIRPSPPPRTTSLASREGTSVPYITQQAPEIPPHKRSDSGIESDGASSSPHSLSRSESQESVESKAWSTSNSEMETLSPTTAFLHVPLGRPAAPLPPLHTLAYDTGLPYERLIRPETVLHDLKPSNELAQAPLPASMSGDVPAYRPAGVRGKSLPGKILDGISSGIKRAASSTLSIPKAILKLFGFNNSTSKTYHPAKTSETFTKAVEARKKAETDRPVNLVVNESPCAWDNFDLRPAQDYTQG